MPRCAGSRAARPEADGERGRVPAAAEGEQQQGGAGGGGGRRRSRRGKERERQEGGELPGENSKCYSKDAVTLAPFQIATGRLMSVEAGKDEAAGKKD